MRVICQPGMPPAAITRTAGAGTGPYGPSPGTGMTEAEAAGTAAAHASTPPAATARAAVIRRSRAAACRYLRGREEYADMFGSRCSDRAGRSGPERQDLPGGRGPGSGRITPIPRAAAAGVGVPTRPAGRARPVLRP